MSNNTYEPDVFEIEEKRIKSGISLEEWDRIKSDEAEIRLKADKSKYKLCDQERGNN